MKQAVTVQGKTVEEAIEQALINLKATRDEVDVEVITNPGKRLFGLRKALAEVKVTRKQRMSELEIVEDADFEKLVEAALSGEVAVESSQISSKGVRVKNGRLEFVFEGEIKPSITPVDDVTLYVNDEQITEKVTIQPDDDVTLSIADELVPPQYSIDLIENNMIALLKFTPGKKVRKTLKDMPYTMDLKLTTAAMTTYYNDLAPQQIVDELKTLGVQKGIVFPAIQKVTQVEKPYELIVARGQSPEEGADGDLEVHFTIDTFNPDSLEKVDFREMHTISTAREGDPIATHVPPVEGKDGYDLLGKVIPKKPVRDITLRLGKNVTLEDGEVIANISGNPTVEWRNKTVKIDINPEFYHPGEVSLESGNIRTEGDVRIGGDVRTSMFVGAAGSVRVNGSVRKATIEAKHSAIIVGNVLSSTITVGKQDDIEQELVERLEQIIIILKQIQSAVGQILTLRGSEEDDLSPTALKQLIHLLLEKKHLSFKRSVSVFIQLVEERKVEESDEWNNIANELHRVFLTPLTQELPADLRLENLIFHLDSFIENYYLEGTTTNELVVPYVANSKLYSNGNIEVKGQGVIQSILVARNRIQIQGVCRGGEIIAQNAIVLQETGSENPVTTLVKVGEVGTIKIGKVYAGTEIQVGNRKHAFHRDDYEIFARLDEEGMLVLR